MVPAGPNQNEQLFASGPVSQQSGRVPMSCSSGANSGRRGSALWAVR